MIVILDALQVFAFNVCIGYFICLVDFLKFRITFTIATIDCY